MPTANPNQKYSDRHQVGDPTAKAANRLANNTNAGTGGDVEQFPFDAELWAGQPLGVILREFRGAYGLNLHQVSDATKIRSVYLDYLEKDEYDNLPGQVYGLGFVKSYASYLGLPIDDMVARYRAQTTSQEEPKIAVVSPYSRENERPAIGIILGALTAAFVVLYLLWFLISRISFDASEGPSIQERFGKFLFGRDHEQTQADSTIDPGLENSPEGSGPIIVDTDGTISVASTPRPQVAQPGTSSESAATPLENTPIEPGATSFPNSEIPVPRFKPDLSALAIQTAQVPSPRDPQQTRAIDPDLPVIAPRAVNVGQPAAFGTATGFNIQPANVEAINLGVPQVTEETATAEAVPEETTSEETASEETATEEATENSPEQEAPTAQPQTRTEAPDNSEPVDPNQIRIVVTAKARTWVQIRDLTGRALKEEFLSVGGSLEVPNLPDLRLLTGDLTALELKVDGRAIKTPESINPATDTIMLNPEALLR